VSMSLSGRSAVLRGDQLMTDAGCDRNSVSLLPLLISFPQVNVDRKLQRADSPSNRAGFSLNITSSSWSVKRDMHGLYELPTPSAGHKLGVSYESKIRDKTPFWPYLADRVCSHTALIQYISEVESIMARSLQLPSLVQIHLPRQIHSMCGNHVVHSDSAALAKHHQRLFRSNVA